MIIASTTTTKERLPLMKIFVDSMAEQTVKPDRHILWLGNDIKNIPIPDFIKKSNIEVMYTEDIGPATKIVPTIALITDPDDMIITVDDDFGLDPRVIEKLVVGKKKYPDAAVGFRGRSFTEPTYNYGRSILYDYYPEDIEVDIITSNYGQAFYRRFFTDEVHDTSECPDARHNDDVWISGHLAKQGIKRYHLNPEGMNFRDDRMGGIQKLWDVNKRSPYTNNIIGFYKPYWR